MESFVISSQLQPESYLEQERRLEATDAAELSRTPGVVPRLRPVASDVEQRDEVICSINGALEFRLLRLQLGDLALEALRLHLSDHGAQVRLGHKLGHVGRWRRSGVSEAVHGE